MSQIVSDKAVDLKDNEERKMNIIVFCAEENVSNLKNIETKMTPKDTLKLFKMKLIPT